MFLQQLFPDLVGKLVEFDPFPPGLTHWQIDEREAREAVEDLTWEEWLPRMAERRGQGNASTLEPSPLCGCTEHSHDEVISAIRQQELKDMRALFEFLNWKTPDGCHVCRPALNYYLLAAWPGEYVDDAQSRFINERAHGNIQKDGTYSVVPRMFGGLCTPADLRAIADVAEKYEVPEMKVTGGQRIDMFGVKKEDLPSMWKDLSDAGSLETDSVSRLVRKDYPKLAIRDGGRTTWVRQEDIEWVDAAGDYMCVHALGETHILRKTMKQLEEELDADFLQRIHRSTIVNVRCVKEMKSHINGEYFLTLSNGHTVKLSRSYKDKLRHFG